MLPFYHKDPQIDDLTILIETDDGVSPAALTVTVTTADATVANQTTDGDGAISTGGTRFELRFEVSRCCRNGLSLYRKLPIRRVWTRDFAGPVRTSFLSPSMRSGHNASWVSLTSCSAMSLAAILCSPST